MVQPSVIAIVAFQILRQILAFRLHFWGSLIINLSIIQEVIHCTLIQYTEKVWKSNIFCEKPDERAKALLFDFNPFICVSWLRYGVRMGKFCTIV
jgi:hypothetical protein